MCRWTFKAQHYDSVMLFKMGKFYEMFNMVRACLHGLMAAIVMHSMNCITVRHIHNLWLCCSTGPVHGHPYHSADVRMVSLCLCAGRTCGCGCPGPVLHEGGQT